MSARKPPREGWVTVADAAKALTAAGDPIDASNVSRYLARNTDIPTEKNGKFRWVDLAALKAHRNTSVFVADKRETRDPELLSAPALEPPSFAGRDDEDEAPTRANSELARTKLEIQQLELRKRQREEALEQGELVPISDLQTVVSGMMGAFIGELARQEQHLAAKFGREVGAEVRKAHKAARAAAADRLVRAAQEVLRPNAAAQAVDGAAEQAEAA